MSRLALHDGDDERREAQRSGGQGHRASEPIVALAACHGQFLSGTDALIPGPELPAAAVKSQRTADVVGLGARDGDDDDSRTGRIQVGLVATPCTPRRVYEMRQVKHASGADRHVRPAFGAKISGCLGKASGVSANAKVGAFDTANHGGKPSRRDS